MSWKILFIIFMVVVIGFGSTALFMLHNKSTIDKPCQDTTKIISHNDDPYTCDPRAIQTVQWGGCVSGDTLITCTCKK